MNHPLRIALCGPPDSGQEDIIWNLKQFFKNEEKLITIMADPESIIKAKTQEIDGDFMNLWSSVWGRLRQFEFTNSPILISPTCGLDQVAHQALFVAEKALSIQTGLKVPDQIANDRAALLNRAGAALQIIINQTEIELAEFWSFVYLVAPESTAYSNLIDQYVDFIRAAPAFFKVVPLPRNTQEAIEFLKDQELIRWRGFIGTGDTN